MPRKINILEKQYQVSIKPHHATSQTIVTDASDHAYVHSLAVGEHGLSNRFQDHDKRTSSTSRELLAIKSCLRLFATQLEDEAVKIPTDDINVARIVKKGSKRKHLRTIAARVFQICTQHDILINTTWIPRDLRITSVK